MLRSRKVDVNRDHMLSIIPDINKDYDIVCNLGPSLDLLLDDKN